MSTNEYNKLIDLSTRNAQSPLDYARMMNEGYDSWNGDRADALSNTYLQMLIREEDFQRSTPEQQVQRLMAAGMSRAAALQAVQGSQYTDVQPQMAGNVEQAKQELVRNITDAVNTTGQFALNIYNVVSTIPALRMQQQLVKKYPYIIDAQLRGYNADARIKENNATITDYDVFNHQQYGKFMTFLELYEDDHKDFKRPDNWLSFVRYLNDMDVSADDVSAQALQEWFYDYLNMPAQAKGMLQAFMRRTYNEDYISQFYNSTQEKQLRASAAIADLQLDKYSADVCNAWASFLNALKQGKLTDEQVRNAQASYDNILAEFGLLNAQTRKTNNEANQVFWETKIASDNYYFQRDALHPVQVKELMGKLLTLNELGKNNGYYYKQQAYKLLKEGDSAYILAQLAAMQAVDYRSFYENDASDFYKVQYVLKQMDILDNNTNEIGVFGLKLKQPNFTAPLSNSDTPYYFPSSQDSMDEKAKRSY